MSNQLPTDLLQQLAARGIISPSHVPGATGPNTAAGIDAANANFQGAFSQMTPAEKQAAAAQGAAGAQGAINAVTGPRPVSQPAPQAPVQPVGVQGVFASASAQDQGQPFRLTGSGGGGAGGVPSGGMSISTVSPQTRAMSEKAEADKLVAAQAAGEAEQGGAKAEAEQLQGIAGALGRGEEGMRAAEDRRRKAYDAQQADYDKIRREADEGVIHPKDVGLMGHIALALGAAGSAVSGAPNFAQQNIHKRIDDDIARQRMNLDNKRKGAEQAREGLGEMRARFGDDRTAEAAERARQLEQAKATGDVLVAQSKSPMLAAKWAGIRAGIEGEQAQMHATMEKWLPAGVGGGSTVDAEARKLYYGNFGKPGNTWEGAYAAALRAHHMATGGTEPVISSAPKGGGGAMSPRLARRMADLDASDKAAARLEAHLNKPGGSLSPAEREEAKSDATILRNSGYTNIPEDPLTLLSLSGARAQGVGEVRRNIANERAALSRYGTGGAEEAPGEGEPDADSFIKPAGSK